MPTKTDGPETWVASQLLPWLDRKDRDIGELARWLAGDLPPVGHEDEPYVWLLRALPLGARRTHYEQELARSGATLIDSADKVQLTDAVLYNLLRLSAGLRGRDALADPLFRMFQAGRVAKRRYTIHKLQDVLRNALIVNQKDNRLEPEWRKMLEGEPTGN